MRLTDILKDSEYNLDLFKQQDIENLENKIVEKNTAKGTIYNVRCLIRNKDIKLTPEEIVRQLYVQELISTYGYPKSRIVLEYPITDGRDTTKRADIVILSKEDSTVPYIIVEVKKPKLKEGKEQLKSYCNRTGAPIGVWCNGQSISYYHRKDPNYFEDITNIPNSNQKLRDIIGEKWTIDDLIKHDKLVHERKSMKDLILEMEDEVLANAGVDVFEEVFKLIFIKLYDEFESGHMKNRNLEFRNYGDTGEELRDRLQNLFDKAKDKWPGVFTEDDQILLSPSHLSVCVASLQDVKLFNSNLEVIDEAFEYLMSKSQKGEKGQFFTPRYVIEMCVRMLNPKEDEKMIDTAAGSCGFPVHTIFYVWRHILKRLNIEQDNLFTLEEKPYECKEYVQNNVFGIDFDEKVVRVARTLNLIAGDGQTNVLHLNTLDFERWNSDFINKPGWLDTYNQGWVKFKKLRENKGDNRDFKFDICMANPPFAGDIKETRIIAKYDLGKSVSYEKLSSLPKGYKIIQGSPSFPEALTDDGNTVYQDENGAYRKVKLKLQSNMSRDILFIERNLDFLKPGGRMAIVLPQGRFNNASDQYLREYIASRCRILAVVGLHQNTFKKHTSTKTSVLFVQKWDAVLCPKVDNYNIFFAVMQKPSKDNHGNKIYVQETVVNYNENHKLVEYSVNDFLEKYGSYEKATYWIPNSIYNKYREQIAVNNDEFVLGLKGVINSEVYKQLSQFEKRNYVNLKYPSIITRPLLDSHGHLIVDQDLYNHDGLTEDGIAEAFIEFAKKERISFFSEAPLTK